MKLTDEQRETINKYLNRMRLRFGTREDLYDDVGEGKRLIREQEWKAEASRAKDATEATFQNREKWRFAYENLTLQLNQAIEVLKWYGNAENYTYQFYTGNLENNELETPIEMDDGQAARDFLAQQEVKP